MSVEDMLVEGFSALGRGDYRVAADCARSALHASPNNAGALTLMGRLALVSHRPDVALSIFGALTAAPCPADTWLDLARTLVALRRDSEAADAARNASEIDAGSSSAFLLLGQICVSLNEREAAAVAFRCALALNPLETRAYLGLGRSGAIEPSSPETARMEALQSDARLAGDQAANLHYGLSYIYKRAGESKRFIVHVFAANAAQRGSKPDARASYERTFVRLDRAFSAEAFAKAQRADPHAPTPIFILGMPRSGTTLVEQIIGGHRSVAMTGENSFARIVLTQETAQRTKRPFPEGFETLTKAEMNELAQLWSRLFSMIGGSATFVTDKTPGNYHSLGLLLLLFPNCKIICMRRDPMDICFSILQHPFDDNAPHTYDIDLLAYAYARFEGLMRTWHERFGDRFLTVQYEDLVARPSEEGRRIIEYCGLDWDESLLDVHKRKSAVHTFSTMQVRRSIYADSVGAWRAFEAELEPLRGALAAAGVAVG